MESLSSYARQFLGQMEKPDVESIEGLPPAISIDQKSTNRNPRSTVGTTTEIYEYLKPRVAKWWLPDEIVFIEAVPKTSVGKFDKKVLRDRK